MKVNVKVHAKSKRESVVQEANGSLKVCVKAPPIDGAANAAVCELLAKHFGVRKSCVTIILGTTSNKKVVEISC